MALLALHASDDDEWKRYQSEDLTRKQNYYIIYGPTGPILIPKAFEVGAIFSSLPEAIVDAMQPENGGKDLARIAMMQFFNNFSFNPIPQALLPAVELAANFDFFTMRPMETEGQLRLPPDQRAEPWTSSIAKGAGSMTGMSPIQIEHAIRGYLGVWGASMLAAGDAMAGAGGVFPARPTGVFGSVPVLSPALENVLGRFMKSEDLDSASRWTGDFYDLKSQADQVYAGMRAYRANGEIAEAQRMIEEQRPLLQARGVLDKTAARMSDLTREMNRIRADMTISGDEMAARLKPLIKERNQLAERATRLAQGYAQQGLAKAA
jgi:hypothetical protein